MVEHGLDFIIPYVRQSSSSLPNQIDHLRDTTTNRAPDVERKNRAPLHPCIREMIHLFLWRVCMQSQLIFKPFYLINYIYFLWSDYTFIFIAIKSLQQDLIWLYFDKKNKYMTIFLTETFLYYIWNIEFYLLKHLNNTMCNIYKYTSKTS